MSILFITRDDLIQGTEFLAVSAINRRLIKFSKAKNINKYNLIIFVDGCNMKILSSRYDINELNNELQNKVKFTLMVRKGNITIKDDYID